MLAAKVVYKLHGPGSFDEEIADFRDGYAIERIESRIVGKFATRDDARDYMLATENERQTET